MNDTPTRPGHQLLFLCGGGDWRTAVHGGSYHVMKAESGWRAEFVPVEHPDSGCVWRGLGTREAAERACQDHYDTHKARLAAN